MLRAAISAFAEKGYAEATVTDIIERARVSRKVFYEHFSHKRDCFLAATEHGAQLIFERMFAAVDEARPNERLRGAVRAYLNLVVEEPEFIRCFGIEIYAAGDTALRLRREVHKRFAPLLRALVEGTDISPEMEPATELTSRDYAVIATIGELVVAYFLDDKVECIPELEDDIASTMRLLYGS